MFDGGACFEAALFFFLSGFLLFLLFMCALTGQARRHTRTAAGGCEIRAKAVLIVVE